MSYLMSNYAPLDVAFVKGSGCWLFDAQGVRYLDALSGVGVVNLGHSHPEVSRIIQSQAQRIIHTSNWYQIPNQEKLAAKLCKIAKMDKAFFCNSGAEAVEAAIKLTRLFARSKNITSPLILTANNSFHGRTFGALSATGSPKVKVGFEPLLSGFEHIDFNDIDAIKAFEDNTNVVAIMLEPIQGESGVIIPDEDYLNKVADLCHKNNWLLILDEVQSGIGRCGKWFAHNYNAITPDILLLAKGLANGIPIGACLAKGAAAGLFSVGSHGSTFGGNHLAAAVALRTLEVIKEDKILQNVCQISNYLAAGFKQKLAHDKVVEIRIKGLMIAIELNKNPAKLLQLALDQKLLINITGNAIRLLPPLILSQKEADIIIDGVCKLVDNL